MKIKPKYWIPDLINVGKIYASGKLLNGYDDEIDKAKRDLDFDKEKELIEEAVKLWTRNLLEIAEVNLVVHNREKLPKGGGHVYIGNHQSYFDICSLLSIIEEPTTVIAKKEFAKVPGLGSWIKRMNGILIDRGNTRESLKAINSGIELLKEGYSIAIFPEGTRSRSNDMGDFKKGSFKLATKEGFPIVPITFKNAAKVFEEVGYLNKGVTLEIFVHDMVDTKNLTREEQVALPDKVKSIIEADL